MLFWSIPPAGGVVDEAALIRGIKSGRISDVVLDVFQDEPEVNRELLDLLTLATPHIAGYSLDGKANGTGMAVRAVSRYFNLGMDHWEADGITPPGQALLLGDAASEDQIGVALWNIPADL